MDGYKLMTLLAATFCLMFSTGCAGNLSVLPTEQYGRELVPHQRTHFRHVQVLKDDDEFVISDRLHLKATINIGIPDYVEVALLDQNGEVMETRKTAYYPRVLASRRNRREARFEVHFRQAPPPGTIIRLSNVDKH